MTNEKFRIRINLTDFKTYVSYEGHNLRLLAELNILYRDSSNISKDDFIVTYSMEWFNFLPTMKYIFSLLKNENIIIELDDRTEILIKNYLNETRNLNKDEKYFELSDHEIESLLGKNNFNRKLTSVQIRDLHVLLNLRNGANFSVPGSGKTTSLLALFTLLKHFKEVEKLFVVSPINAFISWQDEIEYIFGEYALKIHRLTANDLDNISELFEINPDVILVNYEKLRRDPRELQKLFLKKKIHLVLDESHRVKSGENNLSYLQISKFSNFAKRRDILSGTPMPQNVNDLIPQFKFLWIYDFFTNETVSSKDVTVKVVNEKLKGKYVRTCKNELGLKNPVITYHKIQLGPIQKQLYKLFKLESARNISSLTRESKEVFRKVGKSVIRMLQASTNPMLLGVNDNYFEDIEPITRDTAIWEIFQEFVKYEKPSKIEFLKKRVTQILKADSNNKIVIWTYFVRNIKILEKIFSQFNPVTIYGEIKSGDDSDENFREGRIRKFHNDETCRLLIANPQAGGEGISLHRVCHNAIYLDRTFNAAHYLQSLDRIHRLGLDPNIETNIEILVANDTLDELLIRRLNDKIELMGKILSDTYLTTLAYDPEDLSFDNKLGLDVEDFDLIKQYLVSN